MMVSPEGPCQSLERHSFYPQLDSERSSSSSGIKQWSYPAHGLMKNARRHFSAFAGDAMMRRL